MKPRIYFKGFCWWCVSIPERRGWGITPASAYNNWVMCHMYYGEGPPAPLA